MVLRPRQHEETQSGPHLPLQIRPTVVRCPSGHRVHSRRPRQTRTVSRPPLAVHETIGTEIATAKIGARHPSPQPDRHPRHTVPTVKSGTRVEPVPGPNRIETSL
jgi:hypothetical protein